MLSAPVAIVKKPWRNCASCCGKGIAACTRCFGPSTSINSANYPGIKILVHPECTREVVDTADISGSTGKIIREVETVPAGTRWAIGTELHLVNRLKQEHPEQEIHFLSPVVCMCATMYRIDLCTCAGAWTTWRPDRRSTLSRSTPRHRDGPWWRLSGCWK